jgi:hypothetical protein
MSAHAGASHGMTMGPPPLILQYGEKKNAVRIFGFELAG